MSTVPDATPPKEKVEYVSCAGGCGQKWDVEKLDECPWDYLPVSNRRRCYSCTLELQAAGRRGVEAPRAA